MDRAHVLAAAAVAAIVTQPALAAEPCLYSRQIISYKTLDQHTLIVRATGGKRFRVDLGGNCIGLDDVAGSACGSAGRDYAFRPVTPSSIVSAASASNRA